MNAVIELDGLTKFYGKQRGIEDVSFSVDEGEVFGFIGDSVFIKKDVTFVS